MSAFVLFYSRSGTTRGIASWISATTGTGLGEIRCLRYQGGWLPYLAAGRDALRRRIVRVEADPVPDGIGALVLCGPVWAGRLSVPLRSWLAEGHELPNRVGLLLTSGGDSRARLAFEDAADLVGRPLSASLQLSDRDLRGDGFRQALVRFCEDLGLKIRRADRRSGGQPALIRLAG